MGLRIEDPGLRDWIGIQVGSVAGCTGSAGNMRSQPKNH